MQINKVEAIGIAASIAAMALALWLIRFETATILSDAPNNQEAGVIVVGSGATQADALRNGLTEGASASGRLEKIVVSDVVIGDGEVVEDGDTVTVHYIGTLRNGQQFDNTYTKGEPFSFTVGEGRVIEAWDKGIVGMAVGGQRVLIVPPEYAYGREGSGPIPGDATLVFAVELISIE